MKQYTYKELQERLPDYAFGKLRGDEKKIFESSLQHYTDLQEELEETILLFKRIEETDFSGKMRKYSRNVSVEVQEELGTKPKASRSYFSKAVIPTLGLVFMAYILLFTDQFSGDDAKEVFTLSQGELISDEDILSLGSDFNFSEYAEFGEILITDLTLEEEYLSSEMDYYKMDEGEITSDFNTDYLLKDLSESDFQEILKGMYDETLF